MIFGFNPYKEVVKVSDRVERAYNLLLGASMIEKPDDVGLEVRALIGPMLKAWSKHRRRDKIIWALRSKAYKEIEKSIKHLRKILSKTHEELEKVRSDLEEVLRGLEEVFENGYEEGVEEKIRGLADKLHRVEDILWG